VKLKVLILIFIILPTAIYSQKKNEEIPIIRSRQRYSGGKTSSDLYQQRLKQQQELAKEAAALDAPIDPDEYVVGPGDILSTNLWGEVDVGHELQITPEGKLLIPTVKDIDLKGVTLTEAKRRIKEALKEKYLSRNVTVTLIYLRRFRVVVSGQVTNPGATIVSAADRVSDAIRLANPPEDEEDTPYETYPGKKAPLNIETEKEMSKRHITLTRRNGEVIPVDLHDFEINGDKVKNPYLQEGDVIYVPVYTKNLPMVGVYGAVHVPNLFEFMEGDRVMDLINLAHGFTYNADPSNIEIARFNPNNKTTYSFNVDLTKVAARSSDVENNILLQVDDRIFVRYYPEYRIRRQVRIKGEILYPGDYPIERNVTRLSDIVKAAGGLLKTASLKEAFVIRRAYEDEVDPEFERLLEMQTEEMTDLEREYFKIKSRERKGMVAVDFVGLLVEKDSTKDIVLQHKDYIEIPAKDEVVNIMGQVVRPGLVPFKKGKKIGYYIKEAGSYSTNAHISRVRIIRAETGVWEKPNRNTIIYIGDTILVPERPERDYWGIFKDVLSATVQIVSLYVLLDRITEK